MRNHYLLDTNIIIFLLKKQYDVRHRIQGIGIDYCHISEVTYAELLYGAECSSNILIGSTAIANNMIMVTENVKHFENLPGINLENWIKRF